jgi:DNA-binding winged helix-turn-helix (wHTH) protein
MLTARAEESDKIAGLEAGADDYLAKPFSTNELLARIRALLRRMAPEALDTAVEVGGLKLDPTTRRVTRDEREVRIGPTEFRLLHFFMTHPERVHSRAQLLDRVWGDHVFIEERTVDVHVKRLREALEPVQCARMIETVRGAGYRFTQQVQAVSSRRAAAIHGLVDSASARRRAGGGDGCRARHAGRPTLAMARGGCIRGRRSGSPAARLCRRLAGSSFHGLAAWPAARTGAA